MRARLLVILTVRHPLSSTVGNAHAPPLLRSGRHNTYLRNYNTTGVAKILNFPPRKASGRAGSRGQDPAAEAAGLTSDS